MFSIVVEEEGRYFSVRIFERCRYFMKSVFMGKNAAQWLMKSTEQIVVGFSPKNFYTFREGDVAYTLQRCSNSCGLFLLLSEVKVGRSRWSIFIPEGRAKNGWRIFGLELWKMLEPENYVNGGSGQLKFVAQLLKDKSGVPPFKTFTDTVRGHQVQVRGNNQPNLLSAHNKRKMQNRGEKQNSVIDHRRLSDTPVSIQGLMNLGGRDVGPRHCDVEFTLGETNPAGNRRSFPLNFKSKVNDSVFGKDCELRNTQWTRGGLTVEVNQEVKRSVIWNSYKGGLRTSKWVTRSQWEHVMGPPSGSRVQINPVIGLAHFGCAARTSNKGDGRNSKWVKRNQRNFASQGQVMPVVGLDPRCDTLVGLPHLLNSESTGPIRFEVGESSSLSNPRPLTHEAHEPVMTASSKTGHDISDTQTEMLGRPAELAREVDGSVSGGFNAEESPTTPGKADTMQTHSFFTAMNSVCVHEVAAPQAEAMGQPRNSFMEVECPLSEGFHAGEPPMTLGKAETESDRVSMGLFLFNLFLSLSRARIAELGVQGGDKGGWVDFVRVAQGI